VFVAGFILAAVGFAQRSLAQTRCDRWASVGFRVVQPPVRPVGGLLVSSLPAVTAPGEFSWGHFHVRRERSWEHTFTREQRPRLAALLDYARPGEAIVAVGIDSLGRTAAKVMPTIRELGEGTFSCGRCAKELIRRMQQSIWSPCWPVWPSLSWSSGGNVAQQRARHVGHADSPSVRQRRSASPKPALAQRMPASGESASTITSCLGVSCNCVPRACGAGR
jgi:hypothetical protein